MINSTLPINSTRIKVCEYENCKNQFIRRSNNHKYCKEHEKVNNRKDKIKSKKRKYRDENEMDIICINNQNGKNNKNNSNELKNIKKECEELKSIKNEFEEPNLKTEQNTPTSSSKKPNLVDILMKRTSSASNCIGKNKPFHNNHIPQKVDKCIQTEDLFEFIPKTKKTKADKNVGTDNNLIPEPSSPLLDVIPTQQFSSMLDTPTKNIQSINSQVTSRKYLKNSTEYPLRDISNVINCKYLKSPISDRKSPRYFSKPFRLTEFESKNKENFNFNITPIKRELNASTSYRNDTMPYLSSVIPEEELSIFDNKDKDLFGQTVSNINSSSGSGINNEISNNSHSISVDYYMEYIKLLKKISKFSPSQELKQTMSSNSNLTSINNHILSPAKTDAEDLLNWLNIE